MGSVRSEIVGAKNLSDVTGIVDAPSLLKLPANDIAKTNEGGAGIVGRTLGTKMEIATLDDVSLDQRARSLPRLAAYAASRVVTCRLKSIRLPLVLLLVSAVIHSATFTTPAGSNYFNGHLFSTFTGANGAAATTGQTSTLHTFTVTQMDIASGTGNVSQFVSGILSAGSGYPATTPQIPEMSAINGLGLGGRIRYTVNRTLPLGTYV